MTYRIFLAAVLAPQVVLVMAVFLLRYGWGGRRRRAHAVQGTGLVAVLVVVAVIYTAPWDRWLILHTVWTYPAGSLIGTIGSVPIEEYLFMAGQTLLTGLWALAVMPSQAAPDPAAAHGQRPARHPAAAQRAVAARRAAAAQRWRPVYGAAWLVAALTGLVLAAGQRTLYLGAILLWYAPPLALQAVAGADALRRARPRRLAALAPTALLWISDDVAIHAGAWHIGAMHTTGLTIAGLPLEEAVFFLVTNLLVVNSVVLLADPQLRRRLALGSRHLPGRERGELPARAQR